MPVLVSPGNALTINTGQRCFDHLVTAQAGTSYLFYGHAERPTLDQGVSQVCFVERVELRWFPAQLFGSLDRHKWPSSIVMTIDQGGPPPKPSIPDGIQRLWGSFYQQAFITYFETNRDDIEAKFGTTKFLPETLTFGRILRNAFAHGGTIEIR